jgi:hypothetical protein
VGGIFWQEEGGKKMTLEYHDKETGTILKGFSQTDLDKLETKIKMLVNQYPEKKQRSSQVNQRLKFVGLSSDEATRKNLTTES